MTSRDFCYWLQGYFEINASNASHPELSVEQVECIRKHLALVFVHEIDPSAGGPAQQEKLNQIHVGGGPAPAGASGSIHASPTIGGVGPGGLVYRC